MAQSATFWVVYNLVGTIFDLSSTTLVPAEGTITQPDNVMSSRHTSPNYGDGPYFKARKHATGVQMKSLDGTTFTGGIASFGYNRDCSVGFYPIQNKMVRVETTESGSYIESVTIEARIRDGIPEVRYVTEGFYAPSEYSGHVHTTEEEDMAIYNAYLPFMHVILDTGWNREWYPTWGVLVEQDLSFNFKYREFDTFNEILDLGVYLNRSASGFSTAYTLAANGIPEAEVNLIANMYEIMTAVKHIGKGLKAPIKNFTQAIKRMADPRDMWLAYRYSYTTTKLDVSELNEFVKRVKDLKQLSSQTVKLYGQYRDDDVVYKCTLSFPLEQVLPGSKGVLLERAGFDLTVQNVWDMIPYSFVVDWFLGISDLIEWFEDWAGSLDLAPGEIWYSYSSAYDGQSVFYRVRGRMINIPPRYVERNVSSTTVKLRIADTISLFT